MVEVTPKDVENLVVSNGSPESLVLSAADFLSVYNAIKNMDRDDEGVFVRYLHTKIRSSEKIEKRVDISKTKAFEAVK